MDHYEIISILYKMHAAFHSGWNSNSNSDKTVFHHLLPSCYSPMRLFMPISFSLSVSIQTNPPPSKEEYY